MTASPGDIARSRFGEVDGTPVDLVTLRGGQGVEARITPYGGIVVSLVSPDAGGRPGDVVLGFDDLAGYRPNPAYLGAIVGRYANRIAGAAFDLDDRTHRVAANHGRHSLHGGARGFDAVVWRAETEASADGPALVLRHTSPDGDQGYPGTLDVTARYTVTADGALRLDLTAVTDAPTVVGLTQHSYFDLAGDGSVLDGELTIPAGRFVPTDGEQIPTGEIATVAGTPFDFRTPVQVGARIDDDHPQLAAGGGYDHTWLPDAPPGAVRPVARLADPRTGRVLDVLSDAPGLQFYAGNQLDGSLTGKGGRRYRRRSALCFEPQHLPDSVHRPHFPSTVLRPGGEYRNTVAYRLGTA
ncbi:MAG: aldose epimerase family protein [Kineosporiaceae bacterium]